MASTATPGLTADEALTLRRYERIVVLKRGRKRRVQAMVLDQPRQHGQWVTIRYAILRDATLGDEVLSGVDHVAIVGGQYPDWVVRQ